MQFWCTFAHDARVTDNLVSDLQYGRLKDDVGFRKQYVTFCYLRFCGSKFALDSTFISNPSKID
jgi:hypothetical protein